MWMAVRYFDGKASAPRDAQLELLQEGRFRVVLPDRVIEDALSQVSISERIGRLQRRLRFADGSMCEIEDNDTLDAWLDSAGAHPGAPRGSGWMARQVYRLEQRWVYALAALVAVGLFSIGFIRYAVPSIAAHVADHLPAGIEARLGASTLDLLDDRQLFAPSALPPARQRQLRERFAALVAPLAQQERFRLEFRSGGKLIGANAFALPSGVVVMTDELVHLAHNDEELTAVLAHEVGHLVHRHFTRLLLQSSASALLLYVVLGDVSSISSLASGAPVLLTQAKYSRELETEADDYAYAWLRSQGIATHYFGDLLKRLEAAHGGDGGSGYWASHPGTAERIHD